MGFNDTYRFYTNEKKIGSYTGKTFLSFWGFECKSDSETSTHRRDDGYSAKFVSDNKIKIQKESHTVTSKVYWDEYRRKHQPTAKEKDLENRFYNLLHEKNKGDYFWIEKTPYFYESAKGIYEAKRDKISAIIGSIISGIIVLLIVAWLCSIFGTFEVFYVMAVLWLPILIGVCLCMGILTLLWLLISWLVKCVISFILPPYHRLSFAKKSKLRENYLKSLTVGIPEADAILREYAILRGYDKI